MQLSILPRALLALSLSGVPMTARASQMILTCTNPSSGTTWDLKVDFDRRMVNSFPASIDDRTITWEDAQRGDIYEFDRASGDMNMRGTSAMGGYFLSYRCREHK